jgi:hypothetical protein
MSLSGLYVLALCSLGDRVTVVMVVRLLL